MADIFVCNQLRLPISQLNAAGLGQDTRKEQIMRLTTRLITLAGLLSGWLLADACSRGDETTLNIGDVAPEFVCLDDQGQIWKSKDHIGQRMLVVYFYPSDFSFCCTRQAERYRDRLRELCGHGVKVVGISGDAVEAHQLFQAAHKLNFSLLSDGDGDVARKFGVPLRVGGKAMIPRAIPRSFTSARWTFIISKEGRVIYRDTEVHPVKDSQNVLDFVRKLDTK